uniref:Uncharacterized protein n=1 Tax=Anguilla anguilla TaxID=7936 RepID=A0A0E9VNP6_ANGAN
MLIMSVTKVVFVQISAKYFMTRTS